MTLAPTSGRSPSAHPRPSVWDLPGGSAIWSVSKCAYTLHQLRTVQRPGPEDCKLVPEEHAIFQGAHVVTKSTVLPVCSVQKFGEQRYPPPPCTRYQGLVPTPPPCTSTNKVRKTTVTPGPGAWTRWCLCATKGPRSTGRLATVRRFWRGCGVWGQLWALPSCL